MAATGSIGTSEHAALRVLAGIRPRRLAPWADLLLAPVAWALDIQATALLVRQDVPAGSALAWGVHLLFVAFATLGAVDCWRRCRRHARLADEASVDRAAHEDAASLAAWGVGLGIAFGALILAGALPAS